MSNTNTLGPDFLGGVVEGFYGRPWTTAERLQLFRQMSKWSLDTYLYAPKDDLKHRAIWRQPYLDTELPSIECLIQASREHGVRFVYGLSPGLDICFSSPSDRDCIKRRFQQLLDVGAQSFALLFDDLPGQLTDADRQAFSSIAEAQCSVANEVVATIRPRSPSGRFLFCPTPYCDRMDRWKLAGDGYLDVVGQRLDASIDVLWTGPEIVSREIPVASVSAIAKRLRRRPVIWDNLHANDYDGRRVFAGPYSGRPVELKQHVGGILTNPNNEFPINYVAIRTLADYLRADRTWDPRQAYLSALTEWLPGYETVADALSLDELTLLADCYYLPYEDGSGANALYDVIKQLLTQPAHTWHGMDQSFDQLNRQVQTTFDKLTQLRDRELFYAWSRRAWELKEELLLIQEFIATKRAGLRRSRIETHLPGTYRGGFVARLQQLLAMDEQGKFGALETG
jgi:protein O-GlcNAcase/histone acetyltransferase